MTFVVGLLQRAVSSVRIYHQSEEVTMFVHGGCPGAVSLLTGTTCVVGPGCGRQCRYYVTLLSGARLNVCSNC